MKTHIVKYLTTILLFFCISHPAKAVITVSGDFEPTNAADWTGGGSFSLYGYFGYSDNSIGNLNIDNGSTLTAHRGFLGYGTGSQGFAVISGTDSAWNVTDTFYVGYNGVGNLLINGGSLSNGNTGYLGFVGTSSSEVTVTGSGSKWTTNGLVIGGFNSSGMLTVANGGVMKSNDSVEVDAGNLSGTSAIVLNGGTIQTYGTLDSHRSKITGSGNIEARGLIGNGYEGTLTFDNSNVANLNLTNNGDNISLQVTADGNGELGPNDLLVRNGADVEAKAIHLGRDVGTTSTGTVTGVGTSLTVADPGSGGTNFDGGAIFLGENGTGTLNVENGASVTADSAWLGGRYSTTPSVANGTLNVTGAGSQVTIADSENFSNGGELWVGRVNGTGELNITNGGAVSSESAIVGGNDADGLVSVSGTDSTWNNSQYLTVGANNLGTGSVLVEDGGSVMVGQTANIGANSGSTGSVTVTGNNSTWTSNQSLTVGNSGVGTLTIADGGLVQVTGRTAVGNLASSAGSEIIFNSGTLQTSDLYAERSELSGTGTINTNGLVGNGYGTLDFAGTNSATLNLNGSDNINLNVTATGAGDLGSDTILVRNGAHVTSRSTFLGYDSGHAGAAIVSGSGSIWGNFQDLTVGRDGLGTMTIQTGALATAQRTNIGQNVGSTGTVIVTGVGSRLSNVQTISIGGAFNATGGTGKLVLENGGIASANLETDLFSTGTLEVKGTGGTLETAVMDARTGSAISLADGSTLNLNLSNNGSISSAISSTATTNRGGTITKKGTGDVEIKNRFDNATDVTNWNLRIEDGSVTSTQAFVGDALNSIGSVTVTGSGASWTSKDTYIGSEGTGSLSILNDGTVNHTATVLGLQGVDSKGTVTVDGNSSSLTTNVLAVAYEGEGVLNIENGATVTSSNTTDVGSLSGSEGTVNVTGSGSTLTNSGDIYLGRQGTGTLNITDGGGVTNDRATLGFDHSTSRGTATISGQNSQWTNNGILTVGESGDGILSISSGGMVSNTDGYLARSSPNSSGLATITGPMSEWRNSQDLYIGNNGNGQLNINDGGLVSAVDNYVGFGSFSVGEVNVEGSTTSLVNTGNTVIAREGVGSMTVSQGALVRTDQAGSLGEFSGSVGSVTVKDGTTRWLIGGGLTVGNYGEGELTIAEGGVVNAGGNFFVGNESDATGSAEVVGTGSQLNVDGSIALGFRGTGSLEVSQGGVVNGDFLVMGDTGSTSSGQFKATGAGTQLNVTNNIYVGNTGMAQFTLEEGATVSNFTTVIGRYSGSDGEALVTGQGSTWSSSGPFAVGENGTGTLTVADGGTVQATGGTGVLTSDSKLNLIVSNTGSGGTNGALFESTGGDFTNNGTVLLYANGDLAAGAYTALYTAGSIFNNGAIETFGGTYNIINNRELTFNASSIQDGDGGIVSQSLSNTRYGFSNGGVVDNLIASFDSLAGTADFSVMQINPQSIGDQSVLLAFDFTTTLAAGADVYLSFLVGEGWESDELAIWHREEGGEWMVFTPSIFSYDGEWVSFVADGFSSYAVTVPEPTSGALLLLTGAVAMFARRRKQS